MAEFFHAGRTNTDDCYDAGKHMHGSRRVYGHDDASRSRPPAYADDCYNGEVGALAGGAYAPKQEQKEAKERRAHEHDGHFCHH